MIVDDPNLLDSPPILLVERTPLRFLRLVSGRVDLRHRRLVFDDVERHHFDLLFVILWVSFRGVTIQLFTGYKSESGITKKREI